MAPDGDDDNPGTIGSPWQTINHAARNASPGETIYIRGGTYRDNLRLWGYDGVSSGAADKYITFKNYNGEQVNIFFSRNMNSPSDWISMGGNRWRTADYSFVDARGTPLYDVGALWHDDEPGDKKWSPSDLREQWDFYYNESLGRVEVYSTANPATLAANIELPKNPRYQQAISLSGVSFVVIDGLTIKYAGMGGIGMENVHHVIIRNVTVAKGGGQRLEPGETIRYGNGIQLWSAAGKEAHDVTVENSTVEDFYDSCLSNQGFTGTQFNIRFRNNQLRRCRSGIEFFLGNRGDATGDEAAYEIYYEGNLITDTNAGWGGDDHNVWGGINAHSRAMIHDFYIRHNTILRAGTKRQEQGYGVHPAIFLGGGRYHLEGNVIGEGAGYGIDIEPVNGQVHEATLVNNVIYGHDWAGIRVHSPDGRPVRVNLYNNTVVNNGRVRFANLQVDEGTAQADVRNNVIYSTASSAFALGSGASADFNCYYPDIGPGSHSVNADPLFAGLDAADFRLLDLSPCIDAANDRVAPQRDADGKSRPGGNGYDIGAYESDAAAPEATATSTPTPDTTSAPTSTPTSTPAATSTATSAVTPGSSPTATASPSSTPPPAVTPGPSPTPTPTAPGVTPIPAGNSWNQVCAPSRVEILGVGMGSPEKAANRRTLELANPGEINWLVGQVGVQINPDVGATPPDSVTLYAHGGKIIVLPQPTGSQADSLTYEARLTPSALVTVRVEPAGTDSFKTPRGAILYADRQTGSLWTSVGRTLDAYVNSGQSQFSHTETLRFPALAAATDLQVTGVVIGNDADDRPLVLEASAGGVQTSLVQTGPSDGKNLSLVRLVLLRVPPGTDQVTVTLSSPAGNGDSGALIGVNVGYPCQAGPATGP